MRLLAGSILALMASAAIQAEGPSLLDEAWMNYVQDIDHWAYTETTRAVDEKGRVSRETVTRYDPSKPYAEQFSILSHTGKVPIAKMQKWARQRGIDRGEKLERPGGVEHEAKPRIMINGRPMLADLEHAAISEETEQSITYLVALQAEGRKSPTEEHFRTFVTVSKSARAFERVLIQLPEPQQISLLVKLRKAGLSIDFATVDPRYTPTVTNLEDNIEMSAFLRKRSGGHQTRRSDFKRVKPYRERFGVNVGPAKVIEF